jgi:hypothetical protein
MRVLRVMTAALLGTSPAWGQARTLTPVGTVPAKPAKTAAATAPELHAQLPAPNLFGNRPPGTAHNAAVRNAVLEPAARKPAALLDGHAAFNRSKTPIGKIDTELLLTNGYHFDDQGHLFEPGIDTPVPEAEFFYILEEVRSTARLKALMEINLIFSRNNWAKKLPLKDTNRIREIGKKNWPLLSKHTRKRLKRHFGDWELAALNESLRQSPAPAAPFYGVPINPKKLHKAVPYPIDRPLKTLAGPIMPLDLSAAPDNVRTGGDSPKLRAKKRRISERAHTAERRRERNAEESRLRQEVAQRKSAERRDIALIREQALAQLAQLPGIATARTVAQQAPAAKALTPLQQRLATGGHAAPAASASSLVRGALIPAAGGAVSAPQPIAQEKPQIIQHQPAPYAQAPQIPVVTAPAIVPTPPAPVAAVVPTPKSLPMPTRRKKKTRVPEDWDDDLPADEPVPLFEPELEALEDVMPGQTVGAPTIAPVKRTPTPPVQAKKKKRTRKIQYPPYDAKQFSAFLKSAPYSERSKKILTLLATSAPPAERATALGVVTLLLPHVSLDSRKAGAEGEYKISAIDGGRLQIALQDGPVIVREGRVFKKRRAGLLPDHPEYYATRKVTQPKWLAMARDSAAHKTKDTPFGRLALFKDGSARVRRSDAEVAGQLLQALLMIDAGLRGWDDDAFHSRLRASAAEMSFYAGLEKSQGKSPLLSHSKRALYEEWRDRPEDYMDIIAQMLAHPGRRHEITVLKATGVLAKDDARKSAWFLDETPAAPVTPPRESEAQAEWFEVERRGRTP